MWPPIPSFSRFALTTIAIAFQRMMLLIRRSISRLPGKRRLALGRDRVDVRRAAGHRQRDASLLSVDLQLGQNLAHAPMPARGQQIFQRIEPIARLRRIHRVRRGQSAICILVELL